MRGRIFHVVYSASSQKESEDCEQKRNKAALISRSSKLSRDHTNICYIGKKNQTINDLLCIFKFMADMMAMPFLFIMHSHSESKSAIVQKINYAFFSNISDVLYMLMAKNNASSLDIQHKEV